MRHQPVGTTRLLGRHHETLAAQHCIATVVSGHGMTLVVSGEAGIGKSRFLQEVRSSFVSNVPRGAVVLEGACFEIDRATPFAPLRDMLRNWQDRIGKDELWRRVREFGPVAHLLVPEFSPAEGPSVQPGGDERMRLFEDLIRMLLGATKHAPAMLIFEDVHWSDDATLELMERLARRIQTRPVLLAISCRSDESGPSLRRLLAQLDRDATAIEIMLPRLNTRDVHRMLQELFDQPRTVRGDFLRTITRLTDGNPFFIEEMVKSLVASGEINYDRDRWDRKDLDDLRIPRSLQEAVRRRVDGLSPDAAEALRLASVIGQRFDHETLSALLTRQEAAVIPLLREMVSAHLIVEEPPSGFRFRHALTRQAVYGELLAIERRELHARVARAVQRAAEDDEAPVVSDLAYHYFEAGDASNALHYAMLAGERAMQLFAPSTAVDHFSRAIDSASRVPDAPLCDALLSRSAGYTILGEFEHAENDLTRALELARQSGDWEKEWRALSELGRIWTGRDYALAGDYFQTALELATARSNRRAIARSLINVSNWLVNIDRPGDAEEYLTRAMSLLDAEDDARGVVETLDLLGVVADLRGDGVQMREHLIQAAAMYESLDDRRGLSSVLASMSILGSGYSLLEVIALAGGLPFETVNHYVERSLALAREIHWRAGEAYALLIDALRNGSYGNYRVMSARAHEALDIATEIEHGEWTAGARLALGHLHLGLLDSPEAQRQLADAAHIVDQLGSPFWNGIVYGALADACIANGDLESANNVLQKLPDGGALETLGQRRTAVARSALAAASGDHETALAVLDRVIAHVPSAEFMSDVPGLALRRGELLIELGDTGEAVRTLVAAHASAVDHGLRPVRWRADLALGRLASVQRRRREAREHYQSALDTITDIALDSPHAAARGFQTAAASLVPVPYHKRLGAEAGDGLAPLTRRERDVAGLVAAGRTNRDIAGHLYLSERTVESHVSNILGKLGFASRAELTAWVIERRQRSSAP